MTPAHSSGAADTESRPSGICGGWEQRSTSRDLSDRRRKKEEGSSLVHHPLQNMTWDNSVRDASL